MKPNRVETLLLNHRSIRSFTPTAISDTQFARLLSVGQKAASSHYMQAYSVIRVKDPQKLAAISKICNHDFVNDHGDLAIFIADQNRNIKLAQGTSDPQHLADFDHLLASVFDAALAAQNFITAAESEDLGAFIMTSILNDVPALIKDLNLPKYTFPLFGVALGTTTADIPEQKPRLPQAIQLMTETYQIPADYEALMKTYDQTVHDYYQHRKSHAREETFSHMVSHQADIHNLKRAAFKKILEQQGFHF